MSPASRLDGLFGSTAMLTIVTACSLEATRNESTHDPSLGRWGLLIAFSVWCLLFAMLRTTRYVSGGYALSAAMLALPCMIEAIGTRYGRTGSPGEILLLDTLRNAAAVSAAFGSRRILRQAALLAIFTGLGAVALMSRLPAYVFIGVFTVLGSWWLIVDHWDRFETNAAEAVAKHRPFAWSFGIVLSIAAAVLGGTYFLTDGLTAIGLRGFVPTSGGSGRSDPFAARGVGDGEASVAAKDQADSFGAVESELFLASDEPSLYDMFDDSYGEPQQNRKSERAVSVGMNRDRSADHRTATTQQAGRDFTTVRRPAKHAHRHQTDHRKNAVFFAAGRVPLHLRMETFDRFDGRDWSRVESEPSPRIQSLGDSSNAWIGFDRGFTSVESGSEESHVLKILNLDSPRIPIPVQTTAVKIDRVEKPEFYAWTDDEALSLTDREKIPSLQVIHLRSRTVAREQISSHDFHRVVDAKEGYDSARIRELAQRWTQGLPLGVQAIEAIEKRLRTEYTLDPDFSKNSQADAPVEAFLFETKRGPDYLFATASVLLLRSLGYRARFVTGFYACEEDLDREAGAIVVARDDVHCWAEVSLTPRHWLTIEPSPGYGMLAPLQDLWSKLRSLVRESLKFALSYHGSLMFAVTTIFTAFAYQTAILDALWRALYVWESRGSGAARIEALVRLLERRARSAGVPRRKHEPIAAWCRKFPELLRSEATDAFERLAWWSSLVFYSARERGVNIWRERGDEIDRICREVIAVSVPDRFHPRFKRHPQREST